MERWCLVPWFWICFSWGVGYTESRQRSEEWALSASFGSWEMEEIRRVMEEIRRKRSTEIQENPCCRSQLKKYLRRRAGSTVSNVKSWVEWGLRNWPLDLTIWSLLVSLTSSFTEVCTQNQTGEWAQRKWKSRTEAVGKDNYFQVFCLFFFFFYKEEEKKKWYLSWSGNVESRKDFFNG